SLCGSGCSHGTAARDFPITPCQALDRPSGCAGSCVPNARPHRSAADTEDAAEALCRVVQAARVWPARGSPRSTVIPHAEREAPVVAATLGRASTAALRYEERERKRRTY